MEYTNWYGSNPDDGGGKQAEDCVLRYTWAGEDRGWNDFSCEKDTWVHQGVTMEIHALCEAPIIPSQ